MPMSASTDRRASLRAINFASRISSLGKSDFRRASSLALTGRKRMVTNPSTVAGGAGRIADGGFDAPFGICSASREVAASGASGPGVLADGDFMPSACGGTEETAPEESPNMTRYWLAWEPLPESREIKPQSIKSCSASTVDRFLFPMAPAIAGMLAVIGSFEGKLQR